MGNYNDCNDGHRAEQGGSGLIQVDNPCQCLAEFA